MLCGHAFLSLCCFRWSEVCFCCSLQALDETSQQLSLIKSMLCGTGDAEPQAELTAQLAQEVYNGNILELLIVNLAKIDFEVRLPSSFSLTYKHLSIYSPHRYNLSRFLLDTSLLLKYVFLSVLTWNTWFLKMKIWVQ